MLMEIKNLRFLIKATIQPAVVTVAAATGKNVPANWATGAIATNRQFIIYVVELDTVDKYKYKLGYTRRFVSLDGNLYGRVANFGATVADVHALAWVQSKGNHNVTVETIARVQRGQGPALAGANRKPLDKVILDNIDMIERKPPASEWFKLKDGKTVTDLVKGVAEQLQKGVNGGITIRRNYKPLSRAIMWASPLENRLYDTKSGEWLSNEEAKPQMEKGKFLAIENDDVAIVNKELTYRKTKELLYRDEGVAKERWDSRIAGLEAYFEDVKSKARTATDLDEYDKYWLAYYQEQWPDGKTNLVMMPFTPLSTLIQKPWAPDLRPQSERGVVAAEETAGAAEEAAGAAGAAAGAAEEAAGAAADDEARVADKEYDDEFEYDATADDGSGGGGRLWHTGKPSDDQQVDQKFFVWADEPDPKLTNDQKWAYVRDHPTMFKYLRSSKRGKLSTGEALDAAKGEIPIGDPFHDYIGIDDVKKQLTTALSSAHRSFQRKQEPDQYTFLKQEYKRAKTLHKEISSNLDTLRAYIFTLQHAGSTGVRQKTQRQEFINQNNLIKRNQYILKELDTFLINDVEKQIQKLEQEKKTVMADEKEGIQKKIKNIKKLKLNIQSEIENHRENEEAEEQRRQQYERTFEQLSGRKRPRYGLVESLSQLRF